MCPACLTTAAIVLAGGASTGGLAAVLVKKFARVKRKPRANPPIQTIDQRRAQHEPT
jgi:hypothetical protein